MRKGLFVVGAVLLVVFGAMTSCVLIGGDESQVVQVLKDFITDMVSIYEKYKDDTQGGEKAVRDVMEKYIYLDKSLENYSWGDEQGLEAAKDFIASMIYNHIGMWDATSTYTVEKVEILNPTNVPTSLADDVDSYAEITISAKDATGAVYAVKVRGSWYIEAIGWDDDQISYYPWGFVPGIFVGNNE